VKHDDHAFQSAVPHQQIAAQPQYVDRFRCIQSLQQDAQIVQIGRHVNPLGPAPCAPGHVARHRFVVQEAAAQQLAGAAPARVFRIAESRDRHVAASVASVVN
jgi:hypothetical protein